MVESFNSVPPTGKRVCVCVDVSGSMHDFQVCTALSLSVCVCRCGCVRARHILDAHLWNLARGFLVIAVLLSLPLHSCRRVLAPVPLFLIALAPSSRVQDTPAAPCLPLPPPPRIAAHTHTRYFSISTHLQIPPSIESAAVMALQLMRADPESAECLAFSEGLVPLSLDPTKTIRENVESTQEIPFGGTDISLPFSWALENGYVYLDFLVKVKFVAWACQVREMCRRRRVVRGRALTCGNVCMCAQ